MRSNMPRFGHPFAYPMHQYLTDTEFAAESLFRLATDEERQIASISDGLRGKERELKVHQWDFETSDLNDDFSDAYVMAAFARAGRAGQEVEQFKVEIAVLQASVGTHQHSIQAIAGAVLQIAKQGISLVHAGQTAAPTGRMLGSLAIRDIIWQGRNQSMHYEDPKIKQPVADLFSTLERAHGAQFSLAKHPKQNRATQILDLLGWGDYALYLLDMQSLLP